MPRPDVGSRQRRVGCPEVREESPCRLEGEKKTMRKIEFSKKKRGEMTRTPCGVLKKGSGQTCVTWGVRTEFLGLRGENGCEWYERLPDLDARKKKYGWHPGRADLGELVSSVVEPL